MTEIAASDFRHPRRYVRLDTILRLRWLAVLGQLAAIFIVVQGLEFDVPVVPCIAIVGLSALLNLVLQIAFNPMQRLEPVYAAALCTLNIRQLAGLLFCIGGLQDALAATERGLTREQHLTQLDGIAAAAARTIGTPLLTIFLISRQLERTLH